MAKVVKCIVILLFTFSIPLLSNDVLIKSHENSHVKANSMFGCDSEVIRENLFEAKTIIIGECNLSNKEFSELRMIHANYEEYYPHHVGYLMVITLLSLMISLFVTKNL